VNWLGLLSSRLNWFSTRGIFNKVTLKGKTWRRLQDELGQGLVGECIRKERAYIHGKAESEIDGSCVSNHLYPSDHPSVPYWLLPSTAHVYLDISKPSRGKGPATTWIPQHRDSLVQCNSDSGQINPIANGDLVSYEQTESRANICQLHQNGRYWAWVYCFWLGWFWISNVGKDHRIVNSYSSNYASRVTSRGSILSTDIYACMLPKRKSRSSLLGSNLGEGKEDWEA